MSQSITAILPIITRYHTPASRLASMQLQNKAWANKVVTNIFEELFEEQKLCEGAHFRPLLISRIRWTCHLINILSKHSQQNSFTPLYQLPITKN